MPFATRDDLVLRYGEAEIIDLTDRAIPRAGEIDDAVLQVAIDDAEAMIQAHLGAKYSRLAEDRPKALVIQACAIARYHLFVRPTEEVEKRYSAAIKFFDRIGKGEISIGQAHDAGRVTEAGGPTAQAPKPVFSGGAIDDYRSHG